MRKTIYLSTSFLRKQESRQRRTGFRVKHGMTMLMVMLAIVCIIGIASALAAHLHLEKEYQNQWCAEHNGVTEYVLEDQSRVDCLTAEYAVEFDFASKWAEVIGQALYYAEKTGKKPGIVLILEKEQDKRHFKKLLKVSEKYRIRVWIMKPEDLKKR